MPGVWIRCGIPATRITPEAQLLVERTRRHMMCHMARHLLPIVIGALVIELLWLIVWLLAPALIFQSAS